MVAPAHVPAATLGGRDEEGVHANGESTGQNITIQDKTECLEAPEAEYAEPAESGAHCADTKAQPRMHMREMSGERSIVGEQLETMALHSANTAEVMPTDGGIEKTPSPKTKEAELDVSEAHKTYEPTTDENHDVELEKSQEEAKEEKPTTPANATARGQDGVQSAHADAAPACRGAENKIRNAHNMDEAYPPSIAEIPSGEAPRQESVCGETVKEEQMKTVTSKEEDYVKTSAPLTSDEPKHIVPEEKSVEEVKEENMGESMVAPAHVPAATLGGRDEEGVHANGESTGQNITIQDKTECLEAPEAEYAEPAESGAHCADTKAQPRMHMREMSGERSIVGEQLETMALHSANTAEVMPTDGGIEKTPSPKTKEAELDVSEAHKTYEPTTDENHDVELEKSQEEAKEEKPTTPANATARGQDGVQSAHADAAPACRGAENKIRNAHNMDEAYPPSIAEIPSGEAPRQESVCGETVKEEQMKTVTSKEEVIKNACLATSIIEDHVSEEKQSKGEECVNDDVGARISLGRLPPIPPSKRLLSIITAEPDDAHGIEAEAHPGAGAVAESFPEDCPWGFPPTPAGPSAAGKAASKTSFEDIPSQIPDESECSRKSSKQSVSSIGGSESIPCEEAKNKEGKGERERSSSSPSSLPRRAASEDQREAKGQLLSSPLEQIGGATSSSASVSKLTAWSKKREENKASNCRPVSSPSALRQERKEEDEERAHSNEGVVCEGQVCDARSPAAELLAPSPWDTTTPSPLTQLERQEAAALIPAHDAAPASFRASSVGPSLDDAPPPLPPTATAPDLLRREQAYDASGVSLVPPPRDTSPIPLGEHAGIREENTILGHAGADLITLVAPSVDASSEALLDDTPPHKTALDLSKNTVSGGNAGAELINVVTAPSVDGSSETLLQGTAQNIPSKEGESSEETKVQKSIISIESDNSSLKAEVAHIRPSAASNNESPKDDSLKAEATTISPMTAAPDNEIRKERPKDDSLKAEASTISLMTTSPCYPVTAHDNEQPKEATISPAVDESWSDIHAPISGSPQLGPTRLSLKMTNDGPSASETSLLHERRVEKWTPLNDRFNRIKTIDTGTVVTPPMYGYYLKTIEHNTPSDYISSSPIPSPIASPARRVPTTREHHHQSSSSSSYLPVEREMAEEETVVRRSNNSTASRADATSAEKKETMRGSAAKAMRKLIIPLRGGSIPKTHTASLEAHQGETGKKPPDVMARIRSQSSSQRRQSSDSAVADKRRSNSPAALPMQQRSSAASNVNRRLQSPPVPRQQRNPSAAEKRRSQSPATLLKRKSSATAEKKRLQSPPVPTQQHSISAENRRSKSAAPPQQQQRFTSAENQGPQSPTLLAHQRSAASAEKRRPQSPAHLVQSHYGFAPGKRNHTPSRARSPSLTEVKKRSKSPSLRKSQGFWKEFERRKTESRAQEFPTIHDILLSARSERLSQGHPVDHEDDFVDRTSLYEPQTPPPRSRATYPPMKTPNPVGRTASTIQPTSPTRSSLFNRPTATHRRSIEELNASRTFNLSTQCPTTFEAVDKNISRPTLWGMPGKKCTVSGKPSTDTITRNMRNSNFILPSDRRLFCLGFSDEVIVEKARMSIAQQLRLEGQKSNIFSH